MGNQRPSRREAAQTGSRVLASAHKCKAAIGKAGNSRCQQHCGKEKQTTRKRPAADARGTSCMPCGQLARKQQSVPPEVHCTIHQFTLVGGVEYDSKEIRLGQILERLTGGTRVLVLADCQSAPAVESVVAEYRQAAHKSGCAAASVELSFGPAPLLFTKASAYGLVVNYDVPSSGQEYVRRLAALTNGGITAFATNPGVIAYTLIEYNELQSNGCRQVVHLLRVARSEIAGGVHLGGAAKVAELDSTLQQLEVSNDEEDHEASSCNSSNEASEKQIKRKDSDVSDVSDVSTMDEDEEESCDCSFCASRSVCTTSYHMRTAEASYSMAPCVQSVRIHVKALGGLPMLGHLMGPRLPDHACTIICLHNLYVHTPWHGNEHLFKLPDGMGSVRVVFVLADGASWHEYPDNGAFEGGVSWMDILDPTSMDKTDELLDMLVEHETSLLGGCSERIVLMGMSQGGAQSMLRFLRSRRQLAGWFGAVCHAPTAPHLPVSRDPLLAGPSVNCNRPMRLIAGMEDSTFPPALVMRDVQRLQKVGGYTDVDVEMRQGLMHEGLREHVEAENRGEECDPGPPCELLYLQQCLPSMLPNGSPQSPVSA